MTGATPAIYRLHWRGRSVTPGGHKASLLGPGHDFHLQAPYGSHGETRRLDLRAGLLDPQQRVWVRVHRQAASIPVIVLADVSRSMQFRGAASRWQMLLDLVGAIAESAARCGDRFGLVACDTRVRTELSAPPSRNAALGRALLQRLAQHVPDGRGAEGLLQAAEWLPPRRALVFLVSDLHVPTALFERVLRNLAVHDVVPVLLADSAEAQLPSRHGLARLRDLESGEERLLLLRPQLVQRHREQWQARRAELKRIALAQGREPLLFTDRYDVQQFNRYFCVT